MTSDLTVRRALVIGGVVLAIAVGVGSIGAAAAMTAAAAPPPAPPVSIESLRQALAAEQDRGAALQAQLDELDGLTSSLSDALAGTKDRVTTDGKSASALAKQLKSAQSKLAQVKTLLAKARSRLLALGDTKGAAAATVGGSSSGSGGSSGGATGGTTGGTAGGGSSTSMSLSLSLAGGGVRADWTACSTSGFSGYALVRSTDPEIHWPPEDHDTEVARVTPASTTQATDGAAPSGTLTYRVYCLRTSGGETKAALSSPAKQIKVP